MLYAVVFNSNLEVFGSLLRLPYSWQNNVAMQKYINKERISVANE